MSCDHENTRIERHHNDAIVCKDCSAVIEEEEHFIDCDDDGHWYVIEHKLRFEWEAWVKDYDDHDVPCYATSLGCSLNLVIFKKYRVKD